MFIKILTPNHNGMIELTVKDLEALIQEAVDKATREKCAGCSRGYYGGLAYATTTPNITLCSSTDAIGCINTTDLSSIHATEATSNITGSVNTIGETIGLNKNIID